MAETNGEEVPGRRRARRWAIVLGLVAVAVYTAFFFLINSKGG